MTRPTEPATGTRPCVLIVDDSADTLKVVRAVLEQAEYEVCLASDGESALECLSWITPDAILLDAVMPGWSGFETCRRIKADAGLAQIPVIFMTGLIETEHVVEAFAAGGIDYVTKPLREPELLARLAAHWRNGRLTRLARAAVDVAGRGVVLVGDDDRVAWCSPRARQWLDALGSDGRTWPIGAAGIERPVPAGGALEAGGAKAGNGAHRSLGSIRSNGSVGSVGSVGTAPPSVTIDLGQGRCLHVRQLGRVGRGESMLLLEERASGQAPPAQVGALTRRETEVLSWLARGKTNRDIADILGISRHTVSKHLEHLFEKLGVETRSAATAIAARQGLTLD